MRHPGVPRILRDELKDGRGRAWAVPFCRLSKFY